MKNNLLALMIFCMLAINVKATVKDTIPSTDIIDVHLERGVDSLNTVKLIIQNLLNDSVNIYSKFFIDEYYKPSRILIYRCKYSNEKDSVICDWGYFYDVAEPQFLNFSSEKSISIPPKGIISLEIPLSSYYDKSEIYFDIRILCRIEDKIAKTISKITNKIYFEKVMSKLEKYQNENNNGYDKK